MNKEEYLKEQLRSKRLNLYLQGIHDLFAEDVVALVQLCYKLGATYDDIGNALGISRQRVYQKFPKKSVEKYNKKFSSKFK